MISIQLHHGLCGRDLREGLYVEHFNVYKLVAQRGMGETLMNSPMEPMEERKDKETGV